MNAKRREAFSLMEVNLAVFLIAFGLLALFSLFPLGLKECQMAVDETREVMFADYVLGTLEGNAIAITNWNDWGNQNKILAGLSGEDPLEKALVVNTGEQVLKHFPVGTDNLLRYKLAISNVPGDVVSDRLRVTLSVKSGKYGDFGLARVYVTDLIFFGMQ